MLAPPEACLADLRAALPKDSILTGADAGGRARSDQSGIGHAAPAILLRPRTTADVSAALRILNHHGVPVVPQGGMTGLAGGANPREGDVAISLELMRGIEEIDAASATITVLAGTPLQDVQDAAAHAGFFLGLDLGSRGSCQVGGNLSTNAGGIRVIRYGMARDQVLGLEAVLASGAIVSSLNKMQKNNAGYDLKQLFIGSEGTLGIITRAVLRLHPKPGPIVTALCALSTYENVVSLLRMAQTGSPPVMAFEAMWDDYHEYCSRALGVAPLKKVHPFWVILESAAESGILEAFLASMIDDGVIEDCLVAQSEQQAKTFWSVREGAPIEKLPNLVTYDVSLPIAEIGAYASQVAKALMARWPDVYSFFFGHIGDSNLHICVSAPYGSGEDTHTVDEIVYGELKSFSGSVSAEHGIGTLKRAYLGNSRSPAELQLMRTLKKALDPKDILNPGKVI